MDDLKTINTHTNCPDCGSSDALCENEDGSTKCFSCGTFKPSNKQHTQPTTHTVNMKPVQGDYQDLVKRNIPQSICKKYGYTVGDHRSKACQIANYRDSSGKLVGQKLRYPDKSFETVGTVRTLFGMHLFGKGKRITITEGEIDAMSVSSAFNGKWAVVSVPSGAQSAMAAIKHNLEYLNNFDEIVLMFDMDEVGVAASRKCAAVLPVGKAFIANLPSKDPNELLMENRGSEIIQSFWDATQYRPDGIVAGEDMWDIVSKTEIVDSADYPFDGLTKITRGLRIGEIVCFAAGSGVGKSAVCREIAYHLIKNNEKVGYIALEESIKRSAQGIMGLAIDKTLHLGTEVKEEELKKAFDATVGSGNFVTYDHWGSIESDNLINRIRYMNRGLGCKWIFLDHVSICVSGQEGDERKMLDMLMTKLRSLVEEIGVGMILVSHLKRPEGRGFEEGRETTLGHLRGSAGLGQLSDMVIGLERNQQDEEVKNQTTVRVLKNRFSGETGVACTLEYNKHTGRLHEQNTYFGADDTQPTNDNSSGEPTKSIAFMGGAEGSNEPF